MHGETIKTTGYVLTFGSSERKGKFRPRARRETPHSTLNWVVNAMSRPFYHRGGDSVRVLGEAGWTPGCGRGK